MPLVLAACGGAAAVTSRAPEATTATAGTVAGPLEAFGRAEVTVGGEAWTVAIADTPALRAQGLMGVTDLGEVRGMLFVWERDTTGGFWMKDTVLALDIAFFDAGGSLVDLLSMVPCDADPCPTYRPEGSYRYALETPAGGFAGLEGVVLGLP